jgi:septum formation protein
VVLASASPARRSLLRHAGIEPAVIVSDVDEDALLAGSAQRPAADRVAELAAAKADAVAARLTGPESTPEPDAVRRTLAADCVVIGCDSMFLVGGALQGKPRDVGQARERWAAMAGRRGELLTGHAVLRLRDGAVVDRAVATGSTGVQLGSPSPHELSAYLASGEPLAVAGALTIDGLGGWFVDGLDGDASNVVGLSLPLVRRLLARVGLVVTDLWTTTPH